VGSQRERQSEREAEVPRSIMKAYPQWHGWPSSMPHLTIDHHLSTVPPWDVKMLIKMDIGDSQTIQSNSWIFSPFLLCFSHSDLWALDNVCWLPHLCCCSRHLLFKILSLNFVYNSVSHLNYIFINWFKKSSPNFLYKEIHIFLYKI
jgi:hypothetical protein